MNLCEVSGTRRVYYDVQGSPRFEEKIKFRYCENITLFTGNTSIRGTSSYTPVIIYSTLPFVSKNYSNVQNVTALYIHFTITAHVENVEVDEEGVV